jgi:hypothetical protein
MEGINLIKKYFKSLYNYYMLIFRKEKKGINQGRKKKDQMSLEIWIQIYHRGKIKMNRNKGVCVSRGRMRCDL